VTGPAKIAFEHRHARSLDDIADLAEMMFPGKRAHQYTAARMLLRLKAARGVVGSFHDLETGCGISRRMLQRTRAKLARLGLIERVTWMNSRYGGLNGWKLSGRMSAGLRALADRMDQWRHDTGPSRKAKEEALAELLRPTERSTRPQVRACALSRD
jgi:DNA-binding HxlR family transcriptional regulator